MVQLYLLVELWDIVWLWTFFYETHDHYSANLRESKQLE